MVSVPQDGDGAGMLPGKKMNRHKMRLAHCEARREQEMERARAEAARELSEGGGDPQEAAREAAALSCYCAEHNLHVYELVFGAGRSTKRAAACVAPGTDMFIPFITDLDETYANVDANSEALSSTDKFMQYCDAVENTSIWGGHPEILALANVLHTSVHIFQAEMPIVKIGEEFTDKAPLQISYHVKMFGLGEVRWWIDLHAALQLAAPERVGADGWIL
ncbi:ubiquitinyl hydrolase 1 [Malassezia vespertilionis]|uniref:ubiquitinyl hydrolase 1 n=1 Tax=Malassezia vespertilionis TaxID=2020962 RepID=UPI0024B0E173|nr:ubiquitinyl hydrolase 1 [Malassezia vespertilionis]WFD04682.1 ubiquitinyl hydrolase 1 [Malassezia vespertilionis]